MGSRAPLWLVRFIHVLNCSLAAFNCRWLQHSIMARKVFKTALGIWQHPIERPIFATAAWVGSPDQLCFVILLGAWFVQLTWGAQIWLWKPITNCVRFNPFTVSPVHWAISGLVIAAGSLLIVGLLWSLPEHVFGTSHYKARSFAFRIRLAANQRLFAWFAV